MSITSEFAKGTSHDEVIVASKVAGCVQSIRELAQGTYEVQCDCFTLLVVVTTLVLGEDGMNLYKIESDIFPR